jgi:hypothetical protein
MRACCDELSAGSAIRVLCETLAARLLEPSFLIAFLATPFGARLEGPTLCTTPQVRSPTAHGPSSRSYTGLGAVAATAVGTDQFEDHSVLAPCQRSGRSVLAAGALLAIPARHRGGGGGQVSPKACRGVRDDRPIAGGTVGSGAWCWARPSTSCTLLFILPASSQCPAHLLSVDKVKKEEKRKRKKNQSPAVTQ